MIIPGWWLMVAFFAGLILGAAFALLYRGSVFLLHRQNKAAIERINAEHEAKVTAANAEHLATVRQIYESHGGE